jgi:ABC-type multidrug transport system ATPase subunit
MAIINKGELLLTGNPEQFVAEINGNVWKKHIDKKELLEYQSQYKTISTQLQAGKLNIKVFANENPLNGFTQTEADLEDVYFTTVQNPQ